MRLKFLAFSEKYQNLFWIKNPIKTKKLPNAKTWVPIFFYSDIYVKKGEYHFFDLYKSRTVNEIFKCKLPVVESLK